MPEHSYLPCSLSIVAFFLYRNKCSRNELHLQPLWHTRWWLQALDFKIDNVITNLKICSTYTMMPLSERNSHLLMGTLISLTVYYECSCGGGHCNECFPCDDSRNTNQTNQRFPLIMRLNLYHASPMIIATYVVLFA